jgi:hypothetical protein
MIPVITLVNVILVVQINMDYRKSTAMTSDSSFCASDFPRDLQFCLLPKSPCRMIKGGEYLLVILGGLKMVLLRFIILCFSSLECNKP